MGITRSFCAVGLGLSTIAGLCAASPVNLAFRNELSTSDRFDEWDEKVLEAMIQFAWCLGVVIIVVTGYMLCVLLSILPVLCIAWLNRSASERSDQADETDEVGPSRGNEDHTEYGTLTNENPQAADDGHPHRYVRYWEERYPSFENRRGILERGTALSDILEEAESSGDDDWQSVADLVEEISVDDLVNQIESMCRRSTHSAGHTSQSKVIGASEASADSYVDVSHADTWRTDSVQKESNPDSTANGDTKCAIEW